MIIIVIILVFHLDISGNEFIDLHQLNVWLILTAIWSATLRQVSEKGQLPVSSVSVCLIQGWA